MSTPQETASETLPKALNDRASTEDSLNFEQYVEVLESFLLHASRPLTVSIEGEWGSGKSSFMRQLEDRLSVRGHATVEFNPWRYQAEEVLWTAFILAFIDQVTEGLGTWGRLRARLKLLAIRSRHEWRRTLLWAGTTLVLSLVVWTVLSGLSEGTAQSTLVLLGEDPSGEPFEGQTGTILAPLGATAVSGVAFVLWMRRNVVERIKEGVESYHTSAAYEDRVSFIQRFHEDFAQLLDAYVGRDRPVFVFVDDLDRCEASKVADVVESIHLMLADDARLVFLLGMDRQKVAGALAAKHRDLLSYLHPEEEEERNAGLDYGHRYLEKFVQIPFTVPQIPTESAIDLVEADATNGGSSTTGEGNEPSGVVGNVKYLIEHRGVVAAVKYSIGICLSLLFFPLADRYWRFISRLHRSGRLPNKVFKGYPSYQHGKQQFYKTVFPERYQNGSELSELPTVPGWSSQRFQAVILLVAPTLEKNPRRIKRFVNLYTLTELLMSAKRDKQDRSEAGVQAAERPTMEQIGKFVAITLRWPGLFDEIQKTPTLLEALTLLALWRRYDEAYTHWRQDDETRSRTDSPTELDEEPTDREDGGEVDTFETRVVDTVNDLTTELSEDEIPALLDLLIAGMYPDEGEGESSDEDEQDRSDGEPDLDTETRQERPATKPRHDKFEPVARKFGSTLRTHDRVAFFEEVGAARIQFLTDANETYSFVSENEDVVTTLLEASPSTAVIGEREYEEILAYRDMLEENPTNLWARLNLAGLLAAKGRVDEADKHYRVALDHSPDHGKAHVKYAGFLAEQNRADEADEQYQAAIEKEPEWPYHYLEYATFLEAEGRGDEADKQYRNAIDADPDGWLWRGRYAEFLEAEDRGDEADEQYRNGIDIDPDDYSWRTRYARFLVRQDRLDEAEHQYETLLDLTVDRTVPSFWCDIHVEYADVLVRQERPVEAEEQYRAALKLDPDYWPSNYEFAKWLADQDQDRDVDAEKHYLKAVSSGVMRPEPYRAYAEFLRKRDRDEEAKPYEQRAERYE